MITFRQWLYEGKSFEYNGHRYSSGFGRYTKDKESITKDEYIQASSAYKNTHSSFSGSVSNTTPEKTNDVNMNSNIVKLFPEEFKKETESAIKYVSAFDFSGISSSKYKSTKEYKEANSIRKIITSKDDYDDDNVNLEVMVSYSNNCSFDLSKNDDKDYNINSRSRMYGYKNCMSNDKNRYNSMMLEYPHIKMTYFDYILMTKVEGKTDKHTLERLSIAKDSFERYNNLVINVLQDFGINSMDYSVTNKSIMINDRPIKELDEETKNLWMMVSDITYRCLQMNPKQKEFSLGKVFIDMDVPEKLVTNLSKTFPNIKFIMKK